MFFFTVNCVSLLVKQLGQEKDKKSCDIFRRLSVSSAVQLLVSFSYSCILIFSSPEPPQGLENVKAVNAPFITGVFPLPLIRLFSSSGLQGFCAS